MLPEEAINLWPAQHAIFLAVMLVIAGTSTLPTPTGGARGPVLKGMDRDRGIFFTVRTRFDNSSALLFFLTTLEPRVE